MDLSVFLWKLHRKYGVRKILVFYGIDLCSKTRLVKGHAAPVFSVVMNGQGNTCDCDSAATKQAKL